MTPREHLAKAEACLRVGQDFLDQLVKLYPHGVAPEIEARTTYAGVSTMARLADAFTNAGKLALMIETGEEWAPDDNLREEKT